MKFKHTFHMIDYFKENGENIRLGFSIEDGTHKISNVKVRALT